MNIPAISDFFRTIDKEEFMHDIARIYSTEKMKADYNPFTKEQYELIIDTSCVLTQAILAHYHQWLCKQLRRQDYGAE